MHRFVWPLHYASAADASADGVWAPPGTYTVSLKVAGATLKQKLSVLPDPRVAAAAESYAQQFELARRIDALRAPVKTAAAQADALLEQIAARRAHADAVLAGDLDAFAQRVRALTGMHAAANPHNGWAYPPPSVQTLRLVSEWLDKLSQAVDGADAEPSPDARAGIEKIAPLVAVCTSKWKSLTSSDLVALNAKLQHAGAKPIELETKH
jgi:hypothetical protein